MYQIFLTKKCEYQNRLLNILYFHFATFLEIGVVLNLIKLVAILLDLENIRSFQTAFAILKFFQTIAGFLFAALIAVVSLIRNFKMSLYLKLSTRILGKWIVMMVVMMASSICLVSSTYCYLTRDWMRCFQNNFLRTCQVLLVPTFACCFVIISDLTTTKLKEKISEVRISTESQMVVPEEPAVIQINNFFPAQQGPACCSARDHIR